MNRSLIYTDSASRQVHLTVPVTPVSGTLTVVIFENGEEVHEVLTAVAETDGLSFTLPFFLAQHDRELEIRWGFNYIEGGTVYEYSQHTYVEVVRPILPISKVLEILGTGFTTDDAANVEQSVRYIIQAHTGQQFGKYVGVRRVTGRGDNFLKLPGRLLGMNSLNGLTSWKDFSVIENDGWSLVANAYYGIPPVKADYHGVNEQTYSNIPITLPRLTHSVFKAGRTYEIDGVWGWNYVPAAVVEAAMLLIHDYACADAVYRDRFITSMTAADWRIQFHSGAFSDTGNVRANQLLEDYVVKRGWVVF